MGVHTRGQRDTTISIKLATANVNTLLDSNTDFDELLAGMVQTMELQFDRACVDILSVQESREQGDYIRNWGAVW